ncbi:hypothetical protein CHS0354_030101 [Potamilus streckersoni]|uniref:Thioredoxin domain-containing protein n=1 Tax=Potamilus streckersoni TaxID=2493646 RepID=A0AAE0RLG7_9BIVA|nr:hypothetical protein CHS0354_030101 [Potamilus streckersoni]
MSVLYTASVPVIYANDTCPLPENTEIGGEFELKGHTGKTYSSKTLNGKILWIYFGYTFCPDACPIMMSSLKTAYKELGKDAGRVQVLFITIDPERDTLEQLKGYVPYFGETFVGLSGKPEEIRAVADKFRVRYFKSSGSVNGKKYETINHTDRVFLVDTGGVTRGLYRSDNNAADLVKDTRTLIQSSAVLVYISVSCSGIKSEPDSGIAGIEVSDTWVRMMPPGAVNSAGYMYIKNTGTRDIKIVSADSDVSEKTELHTVIREGDIMQMVPVDGFTITAGGTFELKPGSYHVMLLGLKAPLKEGQEVEIMFKDADGNSLKIKAPVSSQMKKGSGPAMQYNKEMMHGHMTPRPNPEEY